MKSFDASSHVSTDRASHELERKAAVFDEM